MEYAYPISPDWSTEEIIAVVKFLRELNKRTKKGSKGRRCWKSIAVLNKSSLQKRKKKPSFGNLKRSADMQATLW